MTADAIAKAPPGTGLVVVELGEGLAVEMAGGILADYGADVIKVERPGGAGSRRNAGFVMYNRGKSSVLIDLTSAGGAAELAGLVARADVVLCAFRPRTTQRLGVGYEQLSPHNDQLVYCAITGFGEYAALRDVRGYEHVVSAAIGRMGQLDDVSGKLRWRSADEPTFTAAPTNSFGAAHLAVQGVLAALSERAVSGRGQRVETSLLDGAFASTLMRNDMRRTEHVGAHVDLDPALEHRRRLRHRGVRLAFLTVQCGDDRWIQMCARQERHFAAWLQAIGLAEALEEPRYADLPLGFRSFADADELEVHIRERMRTRTQAEWMELFITSFDVGADPFLEFDEFLDHPQMVANGRSCTVPTPDGAPSQQLAPFALLADTPAPAPAGAPRPGAPRPGEQRPGAGRARGRVPAVSAEPDSRAGPLAGVRILEVATYVAGPWGSAILAELGADVIKVEPLSGDSYRRSGYFVHMAHGKRSLALDLKQPEGMAILRRLMGSSDALLSNYRPGVADRLGFGYPAVKDEFPQLVYVHATSYGRRGPQARRAAFHSTPIALTGGGILQAGSDNQPVDESWPDPASALAVGTALLLGLAARRRTGLGQYIETSMIASAAYVFGDYLTGYEARSPAPTVDHDQHGFGPLWSLYPCASGWLFLAVADGAQWHRFTVAVDSGLETDARFATIAARAANGDALRAAVAAALSTRTPLDWQQRLTSADVSAVAVDPDEGLVEFLINRGLVDEAAHPDFGEYWRHRPLVRFSRSVAEVRAPCGLGEHTAEVLAELGMPADEIDDLVTRGVAGRATVAAR